MVTYSRLSANGMRPCTIERSLCDGWFVVWPLVVASVHFVWWRCISQAPQILLGFKVGLHWIMIITVLSFFCSLLPTLILCLLVAENLSRRSLRLVWYVVLCVLFPIGPPLFWFLKVRGTQKCSFVDEPYDRLQPGSEGRMRAGGAGAIVPSSRLLRICSFLLAVCQLLIVAFLLLLLFQAAAQGTGVGGETGGEEANALLWNVVGLISFALVLCVLGLYVLLKAAFGGEGLRDLVLPWRMAVVAFPRVLLLCVPVIGVLYYRKVISTHGGILSGHRVGRLRMCVACLTTLLGIVSTLALLAG